MSMFEPIAAARHAEANYIVYILNDEGRIRGAEWIAAPMTQTRCRRSSA